MMSLWNEIQNSLLRNSDSWILDFNNKKGTYSDLLLKIEDLEEMFLKFDFKNKLFVIDYQGNTLDLIILYLFILKKGGCVLIVEYSKEILCDIPFFYALITRNSISFSIDFNHQIQKTPYGNLLLKTEYKEPSLQNTSIILSSSGTTKAKKFIMHSSNSILQNIKSNVSSLEITRDHTTLVCLPLYYSYALVAQFFSHLLSGGNIILSSYKFITLNLISYIEKYQITNFFITPTLLRTLLAYSIKLKTANHSLKFISLGGGYIGKTCFLKFSQNFPVPAYYKTYGISEAGPRVATYKIKYVDKESFDPNYLGVPLDNVSLETDVFFDTYYQKNIYNLTINTPSVFNGYLNSIEIGNKYLGKVQTSDLVYYENDKFYIIGRNTDYFTPFKIWNFEIQDLFFNIIPSLLKVNSSIKGDRLYINLVVRSKKQIPTTNFHSILSNRIAPEMLPNIEIVLHNENNKFTK